MLEPDHASVIVSLVVGEKDHKTDLRSLDTIAGIGDSTATLNLKREDGCSITTTPPSSKREYSSEILPVDSAAIPGAPTNETCRSVCDLFHLVNSEIASSCAENMFILLCDGVGVERAANYATEFKLDCQRPMRFLIGEIQRSGQHFRPSPSLSQSAYAALRIALAVSNSSNVQT
jgi:hypothetical protein